MYTTPLSFLEQKKKVVINTNTTTTTGSVVSYDELEQAALADFTDDFINFLLPDTSANTDYITVQQIEEFEILNLGEEDIEYNTFDLPGVSYTILTTKALDNIDEFEIINFSNFNDEWYY